MKKWRRLLHRYDIAGGENISTVAKAEQDKELCQISMNATSGVHSFVTNKQMTSTVSLELSQPRGPCGFVRLFGKKAMSSLG